MFNKGDKIDFNHLSHLILPGVGSYNEAAKKIRAKGLDEQIKEFTIRSKPFMGICLGMQLMCRFSEENNTQGLGIIDAEVKRFTGTIKIPHMGWNNVQHDASGLFSGVKENEYLYFVHSYYVNVCTSTIAKADYNKPFSAALRKNNFYAIQPHPEKSADGGMKLLDNFLKI